MNDTFAFIIHPLDPRRDIARKYPRLATLPVWLLEFLSALHPPVYLSEITGIQSASDGRTVSGWFVACPLTARMMMRLPTEFVYWKIIQAGRLSQRLGARILGLGAFTSVVGDGGVTISRQLGIPVTTGDSYTAAIAARATRRAAERMGIELRNSTLAVVGAYGSIGAACAEMLAPETGTMLLIGRDPIRLEDIASRVHGAGCPSAKSSTDIAKLSEAEVIITVTSAIEAIIQPANLKPGTVICDVARPRDVARQVAESRQDVLVIDGGMVRVPGQVDFGFDFGFPTGMAYACMAETMALALERRYECFTLGKTITYEQVRTIDAIAASHGFELAGFRSFDREVTDAIITAVREASGTAEAPAGLRPIGEWV